MGMIDRRYANKPKVQSGYYDQEGYVDTSYRMPATVTSSSLNSAWMNQHSAPEFEPFKGEGFNVPKEPSSMQYLRDLAFRPGDEPSPWAKMATEKQQQIYTDNINALDTRANTAKQESLRAMQRTGGSGVGADARLSEFSDRLKDQQRQAFGSQLQNNLSTIQQEDAQLKSLALKALPQAELLSLQPQEFKITMALQDLAEQRASDLEKFSQEMDQLGRLEIARAY